MHDPASSDAGSKYARPPPAGSSGQPLISDRSTSEWCRPIHSHRRSSHAYVGRPPSSPPATSTITSSAASSSVPAAPVAPSAGTDSSTKRAPRQLSGSSDGSKQLSKDAPNTNTFVSPDAATASSCCPSELSTSTSTTRPRRCESSQRSDAEQSRSGAPALSSNRPQPPLSSGSSSRPRNERQASPRSPATQCDSKSSPSSRVRPVVHPRCAPSHSRTVAPSACLSSKPAVRAASSSSARTADGTTTSGISERSSGARSAASLSAGANTAPTGLTHAPPCSSVRRLGC